MTTNRSVIAAGAAACIIACTGDFAFTFIGGSYYPGYSQIHDTMSSLGATASPVSGILSLWWVVMGLLFVLYAMAIYYAFASRPFIKVAAALIMLYGLGEGLGSGLFKADPAAEAIISSYLFHNILGGVGIISILILPLIMKKVIPGNENMFLPVLSNIVFAAAIIFITLFLSRFDAFGIITDLKGLWQRLLVADIYIYLLFVDGLVIKRLLIKES